MIFSLGRGFGLIVFYKLRNQRGAKKQAPANGRMSCIKQPTHSLLPMVNSKMLSSWSHSAFAWLSENYFVLLSPVLSLLLWCILSPNLFLLLLLFTFYAILSVLRLGFVFSPQVVGQICPVFQTLISLETSVIDYSQPMMPRHMETVGMGHGYGRNTNFTNKKWCSIGYDVTWYVTHFEVSEHHSLQTDFVSSLALLSQELVSSISLMQLA